MNYTKNHHLPQWEETDLILMDDFNQMCADMEAGLDKTAADAARATAQAEEAAARLAGNAQAAAEKAQTTADQGVADAARAQAKADAAYSPDQPPYATGIYTGNGISVPVALGFRPRFLVISGGGGHYVYCATFGESSQGRQVQFTETGFTVNRKDSDISEAEADPRLVTNGARYSYIAFR